ncbi:MAG: ABC transporter permease subunit [Longimicrobiaceae bacterium]
MNRMLAWKAWLETRARFAVGAALLAALTIHTVAGGPETAAAIAASHPESTFTYGEYVWLQLHAGFAQAVWIFTALLLAHGGLRRERAAGTAHLTLSLPVGRGRVLLVRTAVCVAELAALALLPALLLAALSPLAGEAYPLADALRFAAAMLGGGLVFFAVGALLAHLFEGEYTAPTVGLGVVGAWFFAGKIPALHWLNAFDLMSGAGHLDEVTLLWETPLPWLGIAASLAAALLLMLAAAALARAADY